MHKIAKALLVYETLSGEEIKDLILKNIQPKRTKNDDVYDNEKSSSLKPNGSAKLNLYPTPTLFL